MLKTKTIVFPGYFGRSPQIKQRYILEALFLCQMLVCSLEYKFLYQPLELLPQSPALYTLPSSPVTTPPSPITYHSTLLFMGDTMLARTVGQSIISGDNPYKYVQSTLDSYDFRMANVETTIADPAVSHQASGKMYTFNAPVPSIQALKSARIDVAGLANNHTKDFGPSALTNMMSNLQAAGKSRSGRAIPALGRRITDGIDSQPD